MKKIIAILSVGVFVSACSTSKKTTQPVELAERSGKPANKRVAMAEVEGPPSESKRRTTPAKRVAASGNDDKSMGSLQFKYAILLDVPIEEVEEKPIFSFIESWYGTPYRYGGFTKEGVDCSAFTQSFMSQIYKIDIPRISAEQFNQSKRIPKKQLKEGDLVFFRANGRAISHVGIYLRNNKFVHASTSSGVTISDLAEDYYARRFAGAGRVH